MSERANTLRVCLPAPDSVREAPSASMMHVEFMFQRLLSIFFTSTVHRFGCRAGGGDVSGEMLAAVSYLLLTPFTLLMSSHRQEIMSA